MSEPSPEPTHPVLIVTGGPRDGEMLALEGLGLEKVVGSGAECHLRLQSGNVEHNHLRVVWEGRGVLLTDLGTSTGTYVNGERIGADHALQDGDRVCLGPPGSKESVKLLVRVPAETSVPGPLVLAPERDPFGLGEVPELKLEPPPAAGPAVVPPTPPPSVASPPTAAPIATTPVAARETAAPGPTPAVIFDRPVAPATAAPVRPRRPGPELTELPSIEPEPGHGTSAAAADTVRPAAERRRPAAPPPRPALKLPEVPRAALVAALVAAGGLALAAVAWLAYARLRPPVPVLTALAPAQAEPRQTVVLTGTGFDAQPRGNAVSVGSRAAEVHSASATQLSITVPADVDAGGSPDVPVAVQTRGGRSNPVFLRVRRLPRDLKLERDVALPGGEAVVVGQNLDVQALVVRVGGVPAEVTEAGPGAVRFVVPGALPFIEGRSMPVTIQVGSDSAPALHLLLGRLPLVTELAPRSGQAGDRVTIRGRGFDAQPSGNAVSFGTEPALVLTASESELVAVAPHLASQSSQLDVPVVVKAREGVSSGQRQFTLQRPSAASFIPRFFAAPVAEDASGERVFVATALGPVLLLSGRDDAPSTAERAVRVATALNAAIAARSPLEARESPVPGVGVSGRPDLLVRATSEDVAGYAPPVAPSAAGARTPPRVLAAYWAALLQDLQALFVDRQRPVRVVQVSPRGKVLLDLYAEAERAAGQGAGVPIRLVEPLPFPVARGFREMTLSVPAQGQASAAAAVTGTWKGVMEEEGVGERPMQLRIHMEGPRLAGSLTTRAGKVGMDVPVQDLTYEKGVLSFRLSGGAQPRRFKAALQGATLAGTIHAAGAGEPVMGRFTLRYSE